MLMKTKTIPAILMLLCCALLCGCYGHDPDQEEIAAYLKQRYNRTFRFISAETIPVSERNYLDARMGPSQETASYSDTDDLADVYEDENGISFHIYHDFRHGIPGSWHIADDYAVQWLMSQPELYEALEESDYPCSYYNTIGMGEAAQAGFRLTVSGFADIRPAAELAFETVRNGAAILPDHGLSDEKEENDYLASYRKAVIPSIDLVTESGIVLESIRFRTEQIPQIATESELIRCAESEYIRCVKDGTIRDARSKQQMQMYAGQNIPVYAGGQQIAELQTDYRHRYSTHDTAALNRKMEFAQLKAICESCGYTYKAGRRRIRITKGDETILISRRRDSGGNRSVFSVYKNGTAFIPEGSLDDKLAENVCCLTVSDYQNLFGITVALDDKYEKAFISG